MAELDRQDHLTVLKYGEVHGVDPIAELRSMLNDWSSPRSILKVREIVIDDRWCRLFVVTPPVNAARFTDLTFTAANRFESLYDEAPADWALDADWKASAPFLACAVYRPVLTTLKRSSVSQVVSVLPQTIDYFNRYHRSVLGRSGWLLVPNASRMVVTVFKQHVIQDVHQADITDELWETADGLNRFLSRECLRLNQSQPEELLLCGPIPEHWSPMSVEGMRVHLRRESISVNKPVTSSNSEVVH